MNPRNDLLSYVDACGGRRQAAAALGIPYPTLCAICNGTRGISRDMAVRLEKASGSKLQADRLVWVGADRAA